MRAEARNHRTGWAPLACWVVGIGTFLATELTVKGGEIAGVGLAAVGLTLLGRGADRRREPVDGSVSERAADLAT